MPRALLLFLRRCTRLTALTKLFQNETVVGIYPAKEYSMKFLKLPKSLFLFAALFLVIPLSGCDKLCKKTSEDVVTIQNMTGRSLSLSVCKGRVYGEGLVNVSQDSNVNELSLGTREASEVRGGMDTCSSVHDDKVKMGISLAPKSFNEVKLCYDDANSINVIIENHRTCPTGFSEQTSTSPCKTWEQTIQ